MHFLSEKDMQLIKDLKERGILLDFSKSEFRGITQNGGVSVFCGDGDIDAFLYHRETVSHRPHSIKVFGGPMLFHPDFKGYDTGLAEGLIRNATWGMGAKSTRSVFLYPHWPCGVGNKFGYTMMDIIQMMPEIERVFSAISPKVVTFFHVNKKLGDRQEQNTYRLVLPEE